LAVSRISRDAAGQAEPEMAGVQREAEVVTAVRAETAAMAAGGGGPSICIYESAESNSTLSGNTLSHGAAGPGGLGPGNPGAAGEVTEYKKL
jgi:hypothetical protein